jgi:hypothetical protein
MSSMTPLEDKANEVHYASWQLTLDAWAHARYDGHPNTVAAMQRRSRELRKALDTFDAAIARMVPQEVRA